MKKISSLLFLLSMSITILFAQTETSLLRFPTYYGNNVVFSYAGDLYNVNKQGGIPRKLTSDIGYEMFAHFSPDGKNIAFTAQYDGNTEVYVMPSEGGIPKRLTYTATLGRDDISDRMGPNNIVMTWKDNNTIVYRSRKQTFNAFKGQLFMVSINGGPSIELPLPTGGFCSFSPDNNKMAFNRVFREFRTWKYYRGGMADDVWIYDFKTKETENITNNVAQDIFPMWHEDKIYFLSDRDRTMNLFCYDITTKSTIKITAYEKYDIKFPSLGDKGIIYENGGLLYIFDFASKQINHIPITISDNFNSGRNEIKDATKNINSYSVSPDGKRIIFGARGDIFSVPAKSGITRNLTQSSGVHDRNAIWSPDGKYIAYISDVSGEDEIYYLKQDGSEKPIQLTSGSDTYKFSLMWSPDSKKILWNDKKLRLKYIDIDTKKITLVDQSVVWEFNDFTWSPDSKWISYVLPEQNEMSKIYIYNVLTADKKSVTEGWYASSNPSFSNDGKYLFFVSNRDFEPIYSWTEWNHAYVDMSSIYFITLQKSTPNPLKEESDEVSTSPINTAPSEAKQNKKEDKNKKEVNKLEVLIDFDGIEGRVVSLPIDGGSYWNLYCIDDNVYYNYNKQGDSKSSIKMFELKNKKENDLGSGYGFEISADNKKMLVSIDKKYAVIDLPKSKIDIKDYTDLSGMKMMVNLKDEWKQIYNEAWRQMRDFFYAPNMHGVDWKAMHDKYFPLLQYVNNRNDLNYIIGELIGELNVGHAYISGGDRPMPQKVKLGLLGAKLIKDISGYYKIESILKGQNWDKTVRSPLTELGVDVKEGEYIIAINGKDVSKVSDIFELLVGQADRQVELTINSVASPDGSRKTIIIPIDDESQLYYYNWVQNNIDKVNKASNGKIGYLHIPDMGVEGLNEFVKYFYPQITKKALIIDDRGNGGGNVSPMIIERLLREMILMRMARNTVQSPGRIAMHVGPKACLIDHYSASDGDLFPYQFRELNIGKLIGTRTWGGVVGIRGSLPFIDGASLNKPEFAHYDAEGKNWIIEGHGVDPDIMIDNDPSKEYEGIDEQLNKGVEVLLEELKNYPSNLPQIPAFPDKSK